MNLRSILTRFRRFERRWIPVKAERDEHEETVRSRLADRDALPPDRSPAETVHPPSPDR